MGEAFMAGLAVLDSLHNLGPEQRFSYRASSVLYQLAERQQLSVRRRFEHVKDLTVSFRAAQRLGGVRTVLPEGLGNPAESWSLDRLIAEGTQSAKRAGFEVPGLRRAIAFGVREAAKLDPLEIPIDRVRQLLFDGLFSLRDEATLDPELLELVEARLLEELERRSTDTTEQFNRRFWGPHGSLPREIAKRVSGDGRAVDRTDVRNCIVRIGWTRAPYVAQCIESCMVLVARSLEPAFDSVEAQFYRKLYYRDARLGGMPLVMLANLIPFASAELLGLWDDSFEPAVFYRMIFYFQEMVRLRRAADRASKPAR